MSILYRPSKANLVVDALSRLSMRNTARVKGKKGSYPKVCKDMHALESDLWIPHKEEWW